MKLENIEIGMEIIWKINEDPHFHFIGKVIKKSNKSITLFFGRSSPFYTQYHMDDYEIVFRYYDTTDFVLAGPSLTKEERLLKKCRTLWNKSKYVQTNPLRAY